jgi:DUF917 family protein
MNYEYLISGGSFYGCGGGGNREAARVLFRTVESLNCGPKVIPARECTDEDVYITAFGVGNTALLGVRDPRIERIREYLLPALGGRLGGVVPVEIGPKSIAQAWYVAALLGVPLVDTDIVGGRASPELFLESITLCNIPRTPMLILSEQGDAVLYHCSSGYRTEEAYLRALAAASGGQVSVVGYAIRGAQLKKYLEAGTVSDCLRAGELIENGLTERLLGELGAENIFEGEVTKQVTRPCPGFLEQYLYLQRGTKICKVYVKNETLAAWMDGKLCARFPTLLVMLDHNGRPLANGTIAQGCRVSLWQLAPRPVWLSAAGQALAKFGNDIGEDSA